MKSEHLLEASTISIHSRERSVVEFGESTCVEVGFEVLESPVDGFHASLRESGRLDV